jgi:hypothetical protein
MHYAPLYPEGASWVKAAPFLEQTSMAKTIKIGRNAGNGQFTTVKVATNKPGTHVVETVKKPK